MSIEFSAERWRRVKDSSRKWWAHELDRPLIQIQVNGYDAKRPKPDIPWHRFCSFYDLSLPVDRIVDVWEYDLQQSRFLGDAFPNVMPQFGAGVAAAFLGANLVNSIEVGTAWFQPRRALPARDLSMRNDDSCVWWSRLCDLAAAARRRFGGLVQINMTDLGGTLDIISSFRPGQGLLLDLYDCPQEVERLTWEVHDRWWEYFDRLNALYGPDNPGYTAWTPIFCERPYYMLQCDFCYMIGPEMFDRFVRPELQASCRRLTGAFYHLDGPGQLVHLDSILSIPELKGVQWVPGAGQPDITKWPDVFRRVHRAGKLIQIFHRHSPLGLNVLDVIADQIGTANGIILLGNVDRRGEDAAVKFLERYGAM